MKAHEDRKQRSKVGGPSSYRDINELSAPPVISITNGNRAIFIISCALTAFSSASNRMPYLNSVKETVYKNKPDDPTRRKIDSVLNNEDYDDYAAKFASIYVLASNDSKRDAEITSLFEGYLNRTDYFSERLQLEIDKEKNLVSEDTYRTKITEILNRHTQTSSLSALNANPEVIASSIALFNTELDAAGRYLAIFDRLTGVTKDLIFPFLTLFLGYRTFKFTTKPKPRQGRALRTRRYRSKAL